MREAELGARVSAALRARGAMVYPLVGAAHAPAGWPDKLVWSPVWDGLLELKAEGGEFRRHQLPVLRQLHERRPGRVFAVRGRGVRELEVLDPRDVTRVLATCVAEELLQALRTLSEDETWRAS